MPLRNTEITSPVWGRWWRYMIVEAAVLIVGDDKQHARPLRAFGERLVDGCDQGLAAHDVVVGVVVVGREVRVDHAEVWQCAGRRRVYSVAGIVCGANSGDSLLNCI